MKLETLEIGRIVNTHGVRGELKVLPTCDGAEFVCSFDSFLLDGRSVRALSKRPHNGCALLTLEGVDTMEKAEALRGKILSVRRGDAHLEPGRWFNGELVGLSAVDEATGSVIGKVESVLAYPASNVLDIRGERHYLVPAVGEFIKSVDVDGGTITLRMLEGMADDED
jgi:16S rRNA processing protein RimM